MFVALLCRRVGIEVAVGKGGSVAVAVAVGKLVDPVVGVSVGTIAISVGSVTAVSPTKSQATTKTKRPIIKNKICNLLLWHIYTPKSPTKPGLRQAQPSPRNENMNYPITNYSITHLLPYAYSADQTPPTVPTIAPVPLATRAYSSHAASKLLSC